MNKKTVQERIADEVVKICEKNKVTLAPAIRFTNGKPSFWQSVCLKYLINHGLVVDIQVQEVKIK